MRDADGWEDINIQRGSYGGKDDCRRLVNAGFLDISEDGSKVRISQKGKDYLSQTIP